MTTLIDPSDFTKAVERLRSFFLAKGFLEVHTQNRLSILAACEDPETVATFNYAGQVWPLPQTGQMWLEHELLKNPQLPGVFCISTSYRLEPNPIEGRHDLIFPMFEFEMPGNMVRLEQLERELCEYLGFGPASDFLAIPYEEAAAKYGVKELEAEHELALERDYGKVVFLTDFPIYTSPFWNMRKDGDTANKIDVIIHGIETIGSAERSNDPGEMEEQFHTISDGKYAGKLFELFGRERVENELNEFLVLPHFPRFGGGIGLTRFIKGMKASGLLTAGDHC